MLSEKEKIELITQISLDLNEAKDVDLLLERITMRILFAVIVLMICGKNVQTKESWYINNGGRAHAGVWIETILRSVCPDIVPRHSPCENEYFK